MARIKWLTAFAGNFESEKSAPLVDMFCATQSDMVDATQQQAYDWNTYMYYGRRAIVFNDWANNGTYQLVDPANPTLITSWEKLGAGAGAWEVVSTSDADYDAQVNQYIQATNSTQDITIKLPDPTIHEWELVAIRKANDSKYSIIFDWLVNWQWDIAPNLQSLIHFTKVDEYPTDYCSYVLSEDSNYIYQRGWNVQPTNQRMSRVLKASPHTIDHLWFPTGEESISNDIDNDNNYVYYVNYDYWYLCRVDKTDWTSTGFSKACPNYTMSNAVSVFVIGNEIRCTDDNWDLFVFDRTTFTLTNSYSLFSGYALKIWEYNWEVFYSDSTSHSIVKINATTKAITWTSGSLSVWIVYNASIDEENDLIWVVGSTTESFDTNTLAPWPTFSGSSTKLRCVVAWYDWDLYGWQGAWGNVRWLDVNTLTQKEEINEGNDAPALVHTPDRLYMTLNIALLGNLSKMVKYYIWPNKINFALSKIDDTVTLISNGTEWHILNEFDTTLSETPRQWTTVDSTPTELFILNQLGERLKIPENFQLTFVIDIVWINQKNNQSCMYKLTGKASTDSAWNVTLSNIEKNIIYKDDDTWFVELQADSSNLALIPVVTGSATSWVLREATVSEYSFIRLT